MQDLTKIKLENKATLLMEEIPNSFSICIAVLVKLL